MARSYWLIKSEPDVFGFEDLKQCEDRTEPWNGIRNYQARNFMRDGMKKGDVALFYHSNAGKSVGVVGLARVTTDEAYPDPLQFDEKSQYFDAKSTQENPRWLMVDFQWVADFESLVSLKDLKAEESLSDMLVVQRGQRLSIQPVESKHFEIVCQMGGLGKSQLSKLL